MLLDTSDGNLSESTSSSLQWPQPCRHFEFSEIESATSNFDESLVIGRGGFGKVYKGNFVNGSSVVEAAIKRLDSMSNQGENEFWAEVDLLSKLRHYNIVCLLGYCNHGKEMILIYEFMPHGTLEDHLHKHSTSLSWLQRLRICIGAAHGLQYLHTGTDTERVIHRDVKSSNILLNESWDSKISDFGLSKVGSKNQPVSYVSTLVKGTFGYLDPDYYTTGRLTSKSDVYAFGVVLFEVLCRKRAVDGSIDDEHWGLVRWAQDSVKQGSLKRITDSEIRDQISPKCLKEFARIADLCLHSHPKQRPTMAKVVISLKRVLALQEKAYASLQSAGRTLFGRMVDMFPVSSNEETSVVVHSGINVQAGEGDAIANLADAILEMTKKTSKFKPNLLQIQETVRTIQPVFNEMKRLRKVLDIPQHEMDMFIPKIEGAIHLVRKCEHIKWDIYKKYKYSRKLQDLNALLLRFFQIEIQVQQARDINEVLLMVKDVQRRTMDPVVIGFDEQLGKLKDMVLKDSGVDNCSVVVVSAAAGYGKTTLVKMLCHDPVTQGKFGDNIYYTTIARNPDIKVIVRNLLNKYQAGPRHDILNDEDAITRWRNFVVENRSEILLVLDDVWSFEIVEDLKFNLPGYKILVTSLFTTTQFDTYKLQLLNHQDATILFHESAFSKRGSERTDIPDNLVDDLVKGCKRHPLTLHMLGCSLKDEDVPVWRDAFCRLSRSPFDFSEDLARALTMAVDVLERMTRECYLDFGLFPEGQKIAAKTLIDMWVHLYKHDEDGIDTLNSLFELSSKNLITLSPIRKDLPLIANHSEEKAVMQDDMMRALAIHLSCKGPVEHRERLIIDAYGEDLPEWTNQLHNTTLTARLMSISTDERFAFRWTDILAPEVEVLVLNFRSKIYTLPQVMEKIERLKVLIITNYGFDFTKLQNFPPPQHLFSLTRIRLEHVSISSIGTSILQLVNLQTLSLIMCEIGNSFQDYTTQTPDKLPSLLEIDMDSCHDLVTFPATLCNLVCLKKLSITNCLALSSLPEGFGELTNLEVLKVSSCSRLTSLPGSIRKLQKLRVMDVSHCVHLCELPAQIGELSGLETIHMRGCTGLSQLPFSIKDLHGLEVICDKEISGLWRDFEHVTLHLVEEESC